MIEDLVHLVIHGEDVETLILEALSDAQRKSLRDRARRIRARSMGYGPKEPGYFSRVKKRVKSKVHSASVNFVKKVASDPEVKSQIGDTAKDAFKDATKKTLKKAAPYAAATAAGTLALSAANRYRKRRDKKKKSQTKA